MTCLPHLDVVRVLPLARAAAQQCALDHLQEQEATLVCTGNKDTQLAHLHGTYLREPPLCKTHEGLDNCQVLRGHGRSLHQVLLKQARNAQKHRVRKEGEGEAGKLR